MKQTEKAQSSIEYLILLAVLVSFFAVLAPAMRQAYSISFYSINVISAKSFAEELSAKTTELSFLGNGSSILVEAKPVGGWILQASSNQLQIIVKDSSLQTEKSFLVEFPNELNFQQQAISEKTVFLLSKSNNLILLENFYTNNSSFSG